MTKNESRYYSLLIFCVAGGLGIIYLASVVHKYLVFAVVPFAWFVTYRAMNIGCPKCKAPIGGRMRNYLGLSAAELKRTQCARCGFDFEAKSKEKSTDKARTE